MSVAIKTKLLGDYITNIYYKHEISFEGKK